MPIQESANTKQRPMRNLAVFSRREDDKMTIFVEGMQETFSVKSAGCDPMPKQRASNEKHTEKHLNSSEPPRSSDAISAVIGLEAIGGDETGFSSVGPRICHSIRKSSGKKI